MRILILDAAERSALAATRSLGAARYNVTVADEAPGTLAGASRFASAELVYPSPYAESEEFLAWTRETLSAGEFDAALPMTEVTTDLLVRNKLLWPQVAVPFAPIEAIDELSDKVRLHQRALELDIPVPRSVIVRSEQDLESADLEIGFPAILKPRRSRIFKGDSIAPTAVRRIRSRSELARAMQTDSFQEFPFLYQELVPGNGQGIFALYDHGQPCAWFAHQRLHEKPPEGGVSVVSESIAIDPTLKEIARRILDDAEWHGVAMIEFKVSDQRGPYLMEINARFWGSLQLAIDAGIDFPRLLLDQKSTALTSETYCLGRRLRWFLGDLDRLYLLAKNSKHYGLRAVLTAFAEFFVPRPFSTKHEVLRWTDPAPGIRELKRYFSLSRGS